MNKIYKSKKSSCSSNTILNEFLGLKIFLPSLRSNTRQLSHSMVIQCLPMERILIIYISDSSSRIIFI